MSNTQKKEKMSVVKKMMIALVGGLIVGLAFMFIRSSMLASGNEGTWDIINKILFQDITAADGTAALGLFYIIGQLFMRGLQAAIVPLVLCSLSLAMCSISSSTKLGRCCLSFINIATYCTNKFFHVFLLPFFLFFIF